MFDLVIRNGLLVDGTGAPARHADIAVSQGTVVEVGSRLGAGHREIDAEGLLVTPGFVDIHTHYDGQATWDPMLTPSSWHGVTTAVFGNCGVGFAPVHRGTERYLINLMEGVEDIPESVLAEGVPFDWESFPEYLDALARMPRAIDVGAQLPHGVLRYYVMGEAGADHANIPDDAQIAEMARLLEQAFAAGALGFSTSRTTKHRAKDGRFTPSLSAGEPELFGLARAMRRAGTGVIQVNSDFGAGEFDVLRRAAEIAGRPLSVLLLQSPIDPLRWRVTLDQIHAARAAGIEAVGQVGARPIGIVMGLETTAHPFANHPAWLAMGALSPAERYARLHANAALRRRLVEEVPTDPLSRFHAQLLAISYPLRDPLDFEPDPSSSVTALAATHRRDPRALALELMMADEGKALLMHPFENYCDGNLDAVRAMLLDDATVMGLGDGGAHVGVICDSSAPTSLLTLWTRDRTRGEKLPLEFVVRKQTSVTAASYGLHDRGVLAPGYRADFNVIDLDALRVRVPSVVYDLPTGGKRLIQRADGYVHTFVAGVQTLHQDELTGERPGRLVRGTQRAGARARAA